MSFQFESVVTGLETSVELNRMPRFPGGVGLRAWLVVVASCAAAIVSALLTPSSIVRVFLVVFVVGVIVLVIWLWRHERTLARVTSSRRARVLADRSAMGADGTLTIRRIARRAEVLRAYVVEVDGVDLGMIRDGETIELPLPPGRYAVRVRVDWMGSPTVDVEVSPEGRVRLRCENAVSNPFQLFWLSSVGRNRYLALERE